MDRIPLVEMYADRSIGAALVSTSSSSFCSHKYDSGQNTEGVRTRSHYKIQSPIKDRLEGEGKRRHDSDFRMGTNQGSETADPPTKKGRNDIGGAA